MGDRGQERGDPGAGHPGGERGGPHDDVSVRSDDGGGGGALGGGAGASGVAFGGLWGGGGVGVIECIRWGYDLVGAVELPAGCWCGMVCHVAKGRYIYVLAG